MRVALLFPGQGAQHVGMGKDWCEASSAARATFELADRVLGFGLSAACWREGEEVNRTDIAQPGIFTTSVAIVRALEERGWKRDAIELTAGLSLGEYTALWFAGSLSFEDGLRLVRLRGEAMQAASEQIPSTMLSLMGATEEQARALAGAAAAQGICQVANLNAPGQVVLSGSSPRSPPPRAWPRTMGSAARAGWSSPAASTPNACARPRADSRPRCARSRSARRASIS